MSNNLAPTITMVSPLAWIGRQSLGFLGYLGGIASMVQKAITASWQRGLDSDRSLREGVAHELSWILLYGMPFCGLIHVGLGSFLSMQSYFGGTFVDGTGAVVGVGLVRNVAPLFGGFTLAGLLSARLIPQLRALKRVPDQPTSEKTGLLDRVSSGLKPVPKVEPPSLDRSVAAQLIAAMIAGPIFAMWGALVGMVVGWQVGQTLLGVSTHNFYLMFWELLWYRDVWGLAVKGVAFGFAAGLFACHEGVRGPANADLASMSADACRAACLGTAAILFFNSGWFILIYHAGPAFGPTLMAPPG